MPRRWPGAFEALKDRFIGADARRIEDIWQIAYRGGFYRGGPVLMSALSGLDQALWDLAGKALDVPVWRLLGGQVRDRVPAYAWIGGDRPSEVAEAAAARREQGFKAVKMNATAEVGWLESPEALDGALERVAAVKAQGLDVALDFHGRLRKPMAKQLLRLLEPMGLLFVEEVSAHRGDRRPRRTQGRLRHPLRPGRAALFPLGFQAVLRTRDRRHHPA